MALGPAVRASWRDGADLARPGALVWLRWIGDSYRFEDPGGDSRLLRLLRLARLDGVWRIAEAGPGVWSYRLARTQAGALWLYDPVPDAGARARAETLGLTPTGDGDLRASQPAVLRAALRTLALAAPALVGGYALTPAVRP